MKKVVNAIIFDNQKILLIKRNGRNAIHLGKWAFPGGLVNKNETSEQALKREVKEEVGLEITRIVKKIGAYDYFRKNNEKTKGESFLVLVKDFKIKIEEKEVSDFKWLTLEEIDALDCAPGIQEEAMKALFDRSS